MKRGTEEIYSKIVNAGIGESVSTKHNKINYEYTVVDALQEQGYKKGINFDVIFDWKTCQSYIRKISIIMPYKKPQHNIQIGDIFYNSWGYDQTNIDYYQVVSTTKSTISLRQIKYKGNYNSFYMSGTKIPVKDSFCNNEILRKTPYLMSGQWRVNFECGAGGQWDGKPMDYSCYA